MRLKEDSSTWRSSGIVKRDFQHGNYPVPEANKLHSKKDTKRWCKGKPGHEHQLIRVICGYWYKYTQAKCTVCGKEFYYHKTEKYDHLPLQIPVESDWYKWLIPVRLSDGTYNRIDVHELYA